MVHVYAKKRFEVAHYNDFLNYDLARYHTDKMEKPEGVEYFIMKHAWYPTMEYEKLLAL